jgi:DNA-binding NtrC family response regulator
MILLVEDDAISRTDFAETLRRSGYEVLEAADSHQAIVLLEQHAADINLVITDMVLPGVNGLTLVKNIQARWPKLPVIMVSAYLSKGAGRAILEKRIDVLEKPVRPSELVESVQRNVGIG